MTLNISTTSNQYSIRVPSHRFQQGGREVFFFALDLETLDGLLPQRVDDTVVRDANRRLTPSHARNIQTYLDEKADWVLGALMLGIAPNAVEFEPYKSNQGGQPFPNFGELRILTNRVNTMRIFDGQHRRRAIQDVLADLSNDHDSRSPRQGRHTAKGLNDYRPLRRGRHQDASSDVLGRIEYQDHRRKHSYEI